MAILTGNEIKKQVEAGNIFISDFTEDRLGPNSYDITLHNELLVYKQRVLDAKEDNPCKKFIIPEDGLVLQPNILYLARTAEFTETNGFAPMIEGRSSMGRLGLAIHATAGFGDNGFKGYWTLEIFVVQPVKVYPGMRIGQLYYHTLEGSGEIKYRGKYYDNSGIQSSGSFKDF